MITVQSKGAGSLKLPRGRASRFGRVAERPMQARMPDLGKGRGEAHAPRAFSLLLHSLFPPGVPASSVQEHLHSHNYIAL